MFRWLGCFEYFLERSQSVVDCAVWCEVFGYFRGFDLVEVFGEF